MRWEGTLDVPTTGTYRFSMDITGVGRLFVNGQKLIDVNANERSVLGEGTIELTAGQPAHIVVENVPFYLNLGNFEVHFSHIRLGAQTPADGDPIAQAAQTAKDADVAVVFASDLTAESSDRTSLALPGEQDALINAVADANPNTVVVLNTSSAVTMPWLNKVRSVLEVWYPGQEYGTALAKLLFGDVNPSGKLPLTFPASDQQGPWALGTDQFPGNGTTVQYSEGIFVGYRWYDKNNVAPLFPFGYGLSYTTFGFSNPTVGPRADGGVDVSFNVTNTGSRAGAEVPQVYVGPGPAVSGVQQAVRALGGSAKVTLAPGETKRVTVAVAARAFQYWSTASHNWVTNLGARTIWAGDSSTNLPLTSTFTLGANGVFATGASGAVGGSVPATLALTLGTPSTFGAFTPGSDKTYDTQTTATVISTAGDATLSVADPSSTAPGRLVNGTFALSEPLQARANSGVFAPLSTTSNAPLALLTYTGPVSNDAVTIGFRQHIAASQPLRTGNYSKTLTFTLSTTTP